MAMNSEHWPPDISGLNEAIALSRAAFQTMKPIVKFSIKMFSKSMKKVKKKFDFTPETGKNDQMFRGFNPITKCI